MITKTIIVQNYIKVNAAVTLPAIFENTVKPLNSGHQRVLKNLSVIERCPLLGADLKKIVTFGTQHFIDYSWHVHYLGCPVLGGFTVFWNYILSSKKFDCPLFLCVQYWSERFSPFIMKKFVFSDIRNNVYYSKFWN